LKKICGCASASVGAGAEPGAGAGVGAGAGARAGAGVGAGVGAGAGAGAAAGAGAITGAGASALAGAKTDAGAGAGAGESGGGDHGFSNRCSVGEDIGTMFHSNMGAMKGILSRGSCFRSLVRRSGTGTEKSISSSPSTTGFQVTFNLGRASAPRSRRSYSEGCASAASANGFPMDRSGVDNVSLGATVPSLG
jgi:hypothetical protein